MHADTRCTVRSGTRRVMRSPSQATGGIGQHHGGGLRLVTHFCQGHDTG